ncbi:hypothetical protein G210_5092, partial [Candida maltosa Xu316]
MVTFSPIETTSAGSLYTTSWTTTDSNGKEITQSGIVTADATTTSTLATFPGAATSDNGTLFTSTWTTTDGNGNEVTQSGL